MKKLYILVLTSFLFTFSLTAQNWSLVMPNDTLVYEKQDNNQFFTVWVDSIEVNGTDTTYFMNRISPGELIGQANDSDVCLPPNTFNGWNPITFQEKTKPQFCGAQIKVQGIKTEIIFPQSSFVIYPDNSVGSYWISDSIQLDTMKVINANTAFLSVFQVQDSIKVFEFKGNTFTLSKNHGLVSSIELTDTLSPTFDLVGVQNLGLGDIIPMYADFFDYSVGDIFVRLIERFDPEGITKEVSKHEITSKSVVNDTLIYDYFDYNTNSIGVLKYWKEMNPLLNSFPNTISPCKPYYITGINEYWPNSQVLVFRNDSGYIQKRTIPFVFAYGSIKGFCDTANFWIEFNAIGPAAVYQGGLEPVYEGYNYDGGSINQLIGYIVDGIPHGNTTSVAELDYSNLINIYPNPANDFLNITTEKINGISVLEMYDLQGRLITTKNFESNIQLNVNQYQSGVYFLVIKDRDGSVLHREKVVIQ